MTTFYMVLTATVLLLVAGFVYETRSIRAEMAEIRTDLEGHVVASLYYKQTFDMLREQFERAARSQIARQAEDARQ